MTDRMNLQMVCERLDGRAHDLRQLIERLRAVGFDKIADRLVITVTVLDELKGMISDLPGGIGAQTLSPLSRP